MLLAGGKPGLSTPAPKRLRRPLGLAIVVCLLAIGVEGAALAPNGVTAGGHHHKHKKHKQQKQKPQLPARFFGISPNRGLPTPAEFARMKRGGIRSYRIPLGWSRVWRSSGPPDWGYFDFEVALAAQAHLSALPVSLLDALLAQHLIAYGPRPHRRPAQGVDRFSESRRRAVRAPWEVLENLLDPALPADPLLADLERGECHLVHGAGFRFGLRQAAEDLQQGDQAGGPWRECCDWRPLWSAATSEDAERRHVPAAPLQDQGSQIKLRHRGAPSLRARPERDARADHEDPHDHAQGWGRANSFVAG